MRKLALFILLIAATSCIETPTEIPINPNSSESGALILNEGIWGNNNASLMAINFKNGDIYSDYFSMNNDGLMLGDLANDLLIRDTTAWIVMTGSQVIHQINLRSGKLMQRIALSGTKQPRKLFFASANLALVTNLYDNSVTLFNPINGEIIKDIPTGSAPEGISGNSEIFIVANSGLGDFRKDDIGAGKAYIFDSETFNKIGEIDGLPNADQVLYSSTTGLFYISYRNLPSLKDSLGGIIEFDGINFRKLREWRLNPFKMALTDDGKYLYIITTNSLKLIDLESNVLDVETLLSNPNPNDIWYTIGINTKYNEIWIGNAKNYVVNGELLVYSLTPHEPVLVSRYKSGLIPSVIAFY